MLFNSIEFLVFLPIVLFVFYTIGQLGHHRVAISWLVGASLFFYAWWNPAYLGLMLISIIFNFAVGVALSSAEAKRPKLILAIGIMANLAALFYFKYANFLVLNYNNFTNSNFHIEKIILPLAISFFTFQQIAYLVDAYRKETREYNFLHYCLFVTFFPQLIAGPIVHHKKILPQFTKHVLYKLNVTNLSIGLTIFCLGLFKKVVMADGLSVYASPVFSAAEGGIAITFFEGWSGALAYTFQLYFDFSGYSDMAIGIAKMFNVNLPLNFYSPYKATNIIDFWRRWHITLSSFLRDYLYFPLGGSRKGTLRRYINLLITMLLGGLWHGANWTFVAWGGVHGFYLVINHAWHAIRKALGSDLNKTSFLGRMTGRVITFLAVTISWVMFRAETFTGAINIFEGMAGQHGFVLPAQVINVIPGLAGMVNAVGTMPLLGGGSVMGVFELIGMFAMSTILISLPASHEMTLRLRLIALTLSMYFTIQAVFFSRAPSEFLYFQF
jgi:alginate O-acetyltransferase complex protein AlgI